MPVNLTLSDQQITAVLQQVNSPVLTTVVPAPIVIPMGRIDPAITFTDVGQQRVDDVMPEGTPGTVKQTVTGHVLSLPVTELNSKGEWTGLHGEGIIGYAARVCRQCGWSDAAAAIATTGGLIGQQSQLKTFGRTVASWPAMVDQWFNLEAYSGMSADQLAAIKAQWDVVMARIKGQ